MTTDRVNLADAPAYAGFMPSPRRKEPEKIDFPQRLAALRKERNLTQQALAEMVGMGITQIKRYEAGASQPTLDAIRNLARTLRVSADELLSARPKGDQMRTFVFSSKQSSASAAKRRKSSDPYSKDYC